jgi:hypothetical protein
MRWKAASTATWTIRIGSGSSSRFARPSGPWPSQRSSRWARSLEPQATSRARRRAFRTRRQGADAAARHSGNPVCHLSRAHEPSAAGVEKRADEPAQDFASRAVDHGVEMSRQRIPEDLLGVTCASVVQRELEERGGVVGLRQGVAVDADVVGEPHRDQGAVQAVLEREPHAEVRGQTQSRDELRAPDLLAPCDASAETRVTTPPWRPTASRGRERLDRLGAANAAVALAGSAAFGSSAAADCGIGRGSTNCGAGESWRGQLSGLRAVTFGPRPLAGSRLGSYRTSGSMSAPVGHAIVCVSGST